MSIVNVSDADFESVVLKADRPVLVDYWAEWCGPCKVLAPHVEKLAEHMGDRLIVAKMDITTSPATPNTYGIKGIPTLMIFKDGQVIAQKTGAMSLEQLQSWSEQSLSAL